MTAQPDGEAGLPRLLRGLGGQPLTRLESHLRVHGPPVDPRRWAPTQLIERVEAAGLRGRGGASFPVAVKLRAVAGRRGEKFVLANGTEGEPASKKDRALLRALPHLVLDGLALAAAAVGADEAIVAIPSADSESLRAMEEAVKARQAAGLPGDPRLSLVGTPDRFIVGQETALINLVNTGAAVPTFGARPFERGIRQRPTLVQNVETLAHLALIGRHGPGWFRQLGTQEDPGSALVTLSGAVAAPGVYEIEQGTPLSDVLEIAGAEPGLSAVLVGGYFGGWAPAAEAPRLLLSRAELAPHGASLGAGVIVALARTSCGVGETVRVADYLAAQGAGQCGPCVHGLAAIADTLHDLAAGTAPPRAFQDLARWCQELPRRGACAHPDGAVRFVSSALRVFAAEFDDHARRGRCPRCSGPSVLPTPGLRAYAPAA